MTAVISFAHYFPYALALVFVFATKRYAPSDKHRLRLLLEGAVSVFISRGIVVEAIRFFYHRPRPFVSDPAITALLFEQSYSFPSGHAAFFFALSTTAFLHNKTWGVWMYAASFVISAARVMAGVHYPTDIVAGAVAGVIVGWGVHYFFTKRHPASILPSEERRM